MGGSAIFWAFWEESSHAIVAARVTSDILATLFTVYRMVGSAYPTRLEL